MSLKEIKSEVAVRKALWEYKKNNPELSSIYSEYEARRCLIVTFCMPVINYLLNILLYIPHNSMFTEHPIITFLVVTFLYCIACWKILIKLCYLDHVKYGAWIFVLAAALVGLMASNVNGQHGIVYGLYLIVSPLFFAGAGR